MPARAARWRQARFVVTESMCDSYLPSRRVREEGGYEGADAMVYYGRPGPFTADVEERIVREVRRLAR